MMWATGRWSVLLGGRHLDACIRFLGEDPWVRLRELKSHAQNPADVPLRGQNLLGYRHYAPMTCRNASLSGQ